MWHGRKSRKIRVYSPPDFFEASMLEFAKEAGKFAFQKIAGAYAAAGVLFAVAAAVPPMDDDDVAYYEALIY